MKYCVIDFNKNEINDFEAKSSCEAFFGIETVETSSRKQSVEESSVEKPYVVKMSGKRYGFIYPNGIDEDEYKKSAVAKAKKKYDRK